MVNSTGLRKLILESHVNPATDPLLAGIVAIGNTDYFTLRAIELSQEARKAEDPFEKHALLKQAITLLSLARGSIADGSQTKKK
jgi:hypothetical protein